jgi:hypothetical protein
VIGSSLHRFLYLPHHENFTRDFCSVFFSLVMAKFLARPTLAASSLTSTTPLTVSIEPVVLLSILDHATRRNANQKRVIGTMLGVRSDDGAEVEIRNCFAVPHNESSEQVTTGLGGRS